MRRILPFVLASFTAFAFGSDPFEGQDRYPEFRNVSGLPGSVVPITLDGAAGMSGALSYSTPIAYSLGQNQFAGMLGVMSFDRKFRGYRRGKDRDLADGNGTITGMVGWSKPGIRGTVGGLLLSGAGDSVLNLHFSGTQKFLQMTWGFGAQDVFNTGGAGRPAALPGQPQGESKDGRSFYVVGTFDAPKGIFLSVGGGTGRFRNGFASASVGVGKFLRLYTEYEGWHFNYGATAGYGPVYVHAGLVAGKYAAWSVGTGFKF